ncbi:pentatricopeptide repeat-containing protein At2g22070-like [Amaranthus tricolor]|uniref:pentatricopeptide repeat-containing protein At2g22070-like n=1 Tax=Amaranthus tricolor TaxID=29722 RepID=UPI00258F2855|nr:pentatricopeptide repeat-containing protein At2g22070-like [Amaranthus tricolor]
MASIPSVALNGNLKLEPDIRKTPIFDKSPNVSYSNPNLEKSFSNLKETLSSFNEGTQVESVLYVPFLQECIAKRSVSKAQMVHAHIVKTGTHEDEFVMTFLINVYAKCGRMEYAQKVFDTLPRRNVVSWTGLMTGYVHNLQPEVAIRLFVDMLEVGAYPTNYTFGTILSSCSSLLLVKLGKQIHGYIVKYGTESETSVGNSLCSFYSKCGSLALAVDTFRRTGNKNVVSWTTVISACGDNGDYMRGIRYFMMMLSEDVELNEFTFTSILSLCCSIQALDLGRQIHSMSIKLGFQKNLRIDNSVMYLYLKCGLIDDADKLFDELDSISLVTWNAMIAGHAQMTDIAENVISAHQSGNRALNFYLKMNRSGTKPDLFTLSSVLSVCSALVVLEYGEQVHAQTIKSGFLADVIVGTSLVNMYSKCGNIDNAQKAFEEMHKRTLIAWTSMISAFAQHGKSQEALQLFKAMLSAGEKPNKITFVGVLSACSQAGLVDEALEYFEMMKTSYKIKPVVEHYACLIDMFVRLGRLEDAFDMTKNMGCEPNSVIWSILIAGCRSQGNLELGYYAAEQLLKMKPKDLETYVLLLNMYLSAERWKDVSRVRKIMKDEKLGKLQDWSWLSIKDKIYSFSPKSRSYPLKTEVDNHLSMLVDEAKRRGYQSQSPQVSYGNDDEVESITSSSMDHSEKLAIAFGLLQTSNTVPLRIVKSISMCRDSHTFIKFISEIVDRTIIVRDSKRLHKFVNGHCSCGDFGNLL